MNKFKAIAGTDKILFALEENGDVWQYMPSGPHRDDFWMKKSNERVKPPSLEADIETMMNDPTQQSGR